ncbi:MAG TPA: hypothetical protein PKC43_03875 [Phycisphaerales bacterium]|nr:hypothetical protein [Phycisphaerales bacterium]HMP36565.1 hypothetical protein [Phycisphaerales bacterium]
MRRTDSVNDPHSSGRTAPRAQAGSTAAAARCAAAGALAFALAGCGSTARPPADPIAVLADTDSTPARMRTAIEAGALDTENREAYIQALRRMLHAPGYPTAVRVLAFEQLAEIDPEALRRTLELQLPRMEMLEWRTRVCQMIAERGWVEYAPTLVRAWAFPIAGWVEKDSDRPERKALEALVGSDRVADYLFQTLVEADGVAQQNLRTRCWEMLLRLDQRERLATLLRDHAVKPGDLFLADLRAGVAELGVFPATREEILWVRKLREPARSGFWSEARGAVAALPPDRRATVELRDLGALVAAQRHRPELLAMPAADLDARIDAWLRSPESGRVVTIDFEGWPGRYRQTLREWRGELTWGDLLAMNLAIDALRVPQVRAHLFEIAERDLKDRTTEYGGVIRLDEAGRYEIVEVPPRMRGNDERYNAPQELFDLGYTAIFHFHLHATRYDNARYAAPAQGDMQYADSTRANALVFTFIDRGTLNVDFYRHGGVSVDLGSIAR